MIRRFVVMSAVLGSLSGPALAGDFAAGWPLQLSDPEAGAFRVALGPEVYRTAVSATLADVVVVDSTGREVASVVLAGEPAPSDAPDMRELSWFPLPESPAGRRGDIAAISEIDTDGRVRRVQMRTGAAAPGGAVLVDASGLGRPVLALHLRWDDAQPPFEQAFEVLGSDDLRRWQPVQADARLLALEHEGTRLDERRILFAQPSPWRYFRLMPVGPVAEPLRLQGAIAQLAPQAAPRAWQWLEPAPLPASSDASVHHYRLDARIPVERIDIVPHGNSAARWSVDVRDGPEVDWRPLATDRLAFRVSTGTGTERSPVIRLDRPLRAPEWRLRTGGIGPAQPPVLRLGYVPEQIVFVAEGTPPYRLQAGSARVRRAEAPVAALLDSLRRDHGAAWRPADASTGVMELLAGDAALRPMRDWTTWTLWAVLLLGVTLVGGLALRLLRAPRAG